MEIPSVKRVFGIRFIDRNTRTRARGGRLWKKKKKKSLNNANLAQSLRSTNTYRVPIVRTRSSFRDVVNFIPSELTFPPPPRPSVCTPLRVMRYVSRGPRAPCRQSGRGVRLEILGREPVIVPPPLRARRRRRKITIVAGGLSPSLLLSRASFANGPVGRRHRSS